MAMSMSPYFVSEESGADSDDLQISGWRSASSSRRSSSSSRRSSLGNPSLTGLRSAPPSTVFAEELEDELSFKESQSQAEPWKPNAYIKIGELGRGTFGIVYKCLCVDNNRHFVVKEMEACNHTYRQLAENEVSLLKNIDHKRIIRYYESEMEQDAVTLYTEFMLGGSVLRAIKKYGPLAEKVVLKYTRQLIEALAYIHEKGIVHNDIKCDNLLLDDEDNLKLGDFGSAVQK
uniref:Protein kinase domain-containing protein n=1 Tax=Plectus sambesii TaxID=2011161 RepID=A0A914W9I2_9BILA